MLFLYLAPWVLFRLCMASPLPEAFSPHRTTDPPPKILEPDPIEAVRLRA
jgi:hypothetical protein